MVGLLFSFFIMYIIRIFLGESIDLRKKVEIYFQLFFIFFLTIPGKYVIIDCREEKTLPGGFRVDWTFVSY